MKYIFIAVASLVVPLTQAIAADDDVKILKFLMSEVEICDENYNCLDVETKTLPDPQKKAIPVVGYDKNEGMLKFVVEQQEKWVHQTEVELNRKAEASVICTNQKISRKSDKEVFATYGLGEGC
ncbi:hypothetical protein LRP49_07870 [Enterovibrio sp. ZSDZ35]|uniref:Uncharacterized protein n=1 Tax=Enterovibrio qingdaonensis TaxID=2899818 RepID=A0ABT5QJF8_9GAMM|nr:hypothetical protein [Enterovibrio sp. ZSDZ35]MDD1781120.1 hypothetical protein [Enterovibrio sp. ZSDZ35]